jgi:hypothetical protein
MVASTTPSPKGIILNRRNFAALLVASVTTCFTLPASAQGNSGNHGHGHGHGDEGDNDHGDRDGNGHGNGHAYGHDKHQDQRYFREQDRGDVARYYDGPRNLPPGLRKKYYRNGTLPPGWQKRFRPMPAVVVQELPPVPYGYQRGYYDGYAVVVDPRTRIIYDVMDIVGALGNH